MLSLITAVLVPSVVLAEGSPLVMDFNGSTTVGPIVVQATSDFNAHPPVTGMTVGDVLQTGSGTGWTALSADSTNIANSSSEISSANDVWADAHAIARDGIMIIVTDEVSFVDKLTLDQIEYIYERGSAITSTTWNDVDMVDGTDNWTGDNYVVIPRARETTSGTRDTLLHICSIDKTIEATTMILLMRPIPDSLPMPHSSRVWKHQVLMLSATSVWVSARMIPIRIYAPYPS